MANANAGAGGEPERKPPRNPYYYPLFVTHLKHGRIVIELPPKMSSADLEDLEQLFALVLRQARRLQEIDYAN